MKFHLYNEIVQIIEKAFRKGEDINQNEKNYKNSISIFDFNAIYCVFWV